MAYADLATIQSTDPGDILTAAWCDQTRDNQEFFIDPPACSIYHSTTQSAADNTATTLSADTENYDNDSMHSTSTNNSRITIQTAGRYWLQAAVGFAANATGNRQVQFFVNGVAVSGGTIIDNAGASNSTSTVLVRTLVLAAGDYAEVRATQRSGGALDITLAEFAATFQTR